LLVHDGAAGVRSQQLRKSGRHRLCGAGREWQRVAGGRRMGLEPQRLRTAGPGGGYLCQSWLVRQRRKRLSGPGARVPVRVRHQCAGSSGRVSARQRLLDSSRFDGAARRSPVAARGGR
ncbi:MAG: hypothetical protein ACK559_09125, partial [bacterium]